MITELVYSKELYKPAWIRNKEVFPECDKIGVDYDKTNKSRIYTFYGTEANIRYIQTKYTLKNVYR